MKKGVLNKILVIAVVLGLAAVFFAFDLGTYLTLDYLKASQDTFAQTYAEHQVLVIAGYMLIYILVTSLSLPGAAIMTLAGGALFGLVTGTLVVSFASTIGATLACLVARFLLRDWVQKRFGNNIAKVNAGIEKEGAFYLFTLRLIPVFPFWLINLVMGVTKMPLRTFFWVSQIGMLAGTVVYVNAGKELAKIETLSGILSPGLIISFVVLGTFPIAAKKIITFTRSRREKASQAG